MKKVLVITYDFPFPTNSGGKSRIYHMMKFSKDKNIEFFLYSFTRNNFDKKNILEVEKAGVSKVFTHLRKSNKDFISWGKALLNLSSIFKGLYFSKEVENEILEIVKNENINTVIFESFYTTYYMSNKLRNLGIKQIFGSENIEHMLYYDFAIEKPVYIRKPYLMQVKKIREEEERAYKNSDLIFAVTEEEKKYIEKKTNTRVVIIPNGIDSKLLEYKFNENKFKNLLFVGNFSYFPNIDAMRFFYYEIFLQIPNVKLTIVGKHQDKLPFLIKDNRVENIEFVQDLKRIYHECSLFIFPIRYGGGTNFKVLEAASCGIPIVAIPDRVKGLGFENGKHFISANSAREFMEVINELSENKNLRKNISKNARDLIEKKYDWRTIGTYLNRILTS